MSQQQVKDMLCHIEQIEVKIRYAKTALKKKRASAAYVNFKEIHNECTRAKNALVDMSLDALEDGEG